MNPNRFRPRSPEDAAQTFGTHDAYPPARSNEELDAIDLVDRAAILAMELELHNESQPSRRAAIIQSHLNSLKASWAKGIMLTARANVDKRRRR